MTGQTDGSPECYEFPGVVIIDTREQANWTFEGLKADAAQKRKLILVRTERATLRQGDYSLKGYEERIAIERKSLSDLFSTIGQQRERFEKELAKLAAYDFAAVVVEADWNTVVNHPPEHSQLSPKIIFRSVIAWQLRYPGIAWWFCPDRRFAEVTTFRLLDRYQRDVTAGRASASSFAAWLGKERARAVATGDVDGEGNPNVLDLSDFTGGGID